MVGEYVLPGSLVLLKLGMRLFLDQEVTRVDATKAAMAFPVDLAFLAFTFGAAGMVAAAQQAADPIDMKSAAAFMVSCALLGGAVIVLCKRSDKAFMREKNVAAGVLTGLSYTASAFVVIWALAVSNML